MPAAWAMAVSRAVSSRLGRLGDRERAGLDVLDAMRGGGADFLAQLGGVDPGVVAAEQGQFRATGVELRRGAFVGLDMAAVVGVDGAPGRAQAGQRQGIGGGAGGDQIGPRPGRLEDLADTLLDPFGQRVGAIGHRRTGAGAGHGGEDFGVDPGGVVGSEEHA
jgi:hypothetical protein